MKAEGGEKRMKDEGGRRKKGMKALKGRWMKAEG